MLNRSKQLLALVLLAGATPCGDAAEDPWDRVPEILQRIQAPTFADREFNVVEYGATAGGVEDCTQAVADAIAACHDAGGGRVLVPEGRFLAGPIHLKSNVELHLARGSEIVFSDRFEDYLPVVLVRVGGIELYNYSPLIYARDCTNIAVTGPGKLNGNAEAWWAWKDRETRRGFEMGAQGAPVEERVFGTPEAAIRPSFLSLVNCQNVLLEGFTIGSGPNWTIHPVYCRNTTIRGVQVRTDGPNNDGIDPDSCRDMLIEDCTFDTGDDCVVLKSGYNEDGWRVGRPTENVVMRNCRSKRGHGGLVIGSEMSGDVRNVFMENCAFEGTDRAVRIKSRADRGGVVEDIYVRNLTVKNMQREVVILNMDYGADRSALREAKPPVFRKMRFENIQAAGAPVGLLLQGMRQSPILGIEFRNLSIHSQQGVIASHVSDSLFDGVRVSTDSGPPFTLDNALRVKIKDCSPDVAPRVFLKVSGEDSRQITLENCNLRDGPDSIVLQDPVQRSDLTIK